MTMQQTETVLLGELKVSRVKTQVFTIANIGTGIAVTIFDMNSKAGGIAHIVLPESALNSPNSPPGAPPLPAKFADEGIPKLLEAFTKEGGNLKSSIIRIVGGAQLFNFGGGSGNILNVGARNVSAIQTEFGKAGLTIAKSDVGGNKAKSLRFILENGHLLVKPIGGQEYPV
jgi:chemotaxis protein CheD